MSNIDYQFELDLTGITCPGPLISARQLLSELDSGSILRLVSDCSGTEDDIRAWTRQGDYHLLQTDALNDNRIAFYIQKGNIWPVNITIDMRGARCPEPIIQSAKIFRSMRQGEILKLVSDCTSAQDEVESWVDVGEKVLLAHIETEGGVHIFYLRKEHDKA